MFNQTHYFSILEAFEAASQLLGTDYTKQAEILTTGRTGGSILNILPQLVPSELTPERTMRVEEGKGVLGTLGRWKVYWTPEPAMEDTIIMERPGDKVEILIVTP